MAAKHAQETTRTTSRLTENREVAEMLCNRASVLIDTDRTIMQMYFERGASMCSIAELMGVSTSSIARRIKAIVRRLTGDTYRRYVRNEHRLSPDDLEIARDHFIRGLSMRAIARKRQCSFYSIRQSVQRIKHTTKDPPDRSEIDGRYSYRKSPNRRALTG